MSRREKTIGIACALVLVWVNAYICRGWLYHPTAWTGTLYGNWAAVARLSQGRWHASWWPFWDFGSPSEHASPPLVPALAALLAWLRHTSPLMGAQAVSAIFYCAAPLALFVLAWAMSRAPLFSFVAVLGYSLLSPEQLLLPDKTLTWKALFMPLRFMQQAEWSETPRYAGLTFLLLFLLFLVLHVEKPRRGYMPASAVCLALAMLASPFELLSALLTIGCLLTVRGWRNTPWCLAIVALACGLTARYLPPSVWISIGAASAEHEPWNGAGIFKYLAGLLVVWTVLLHGIEKWSKNWRLAFLLLWAVAMSSGAVMAYWFQRQILPHPFAMQAEIAAALVLLLAVAVGPAMARRPALEQALLTIVVVALAVPQLIEFRKRAKDALYPADVAKTIEFRAAQRIAHDLPGVRVMLPGSIALWANAFTDSPQFSGGEGTTAYSQTQQRALQTVYEGDAAAGLKQLKAYGAAAVVVSGPASKEFWKTFVPPEKFDGVLPEMWREDGVTAYRVPQRSASWAHVVPENALDDIDRYTAALDDATLPEATFDWRGRNRAQVSAVTAAGQAISIQVSYHPGWHAAVDGRAAELHRDARGLMWLRPGRPGPVTVELDYDGGWELRIAGWVSIAAVLAAVYWLVRG